MKPLAISLDKLQGDKNVSIGCVLPCLHFIRNELENVELRTKNQNLRVQTIGERMKTALQKAFMSRFECMLKFNDMNIELILAAVSHPVYKLKWISNEQDMLHAKTLFEKEIRRYSNLANTDIIPEEIENDDDEFLPKKNIITARRLSFDSANSEMTSYFEDRSKNLQMLFKYRNVEKIFRKFNTTLSSSAPVERLFSTALLICTPRRNRISSQNFEKCLLLKKNGDVCHDQAHAQ